MSSPALDRPDLLSFLDDAGWPVVCDRIIHGLCHDLNGRANAVSNIGFLMESGGTAWAEVQGIVEDEIVRLEQAVRLLRILPDDAEDQGLLAPGDFLAVLPALSRIQPGLEHVDFHVTVSPDLPAVRMDETLFQRGLLLLTARAAEDALILGNREVRLAHRGSGNTLVLGPILPEAVRSKQERTDGPRISLPNTTVGSVGRVVEAAGGELRRVEKGDAPGFVEWVLPGASMGDAPTPA